jgi:hypothetical protein
MPRPAVRQRRALSHPVASAGAGQFMPGRRNFLAANGKPAHDGVTAGVWLESGVIPDA